MRRVLLLIPILFTTATLPAPIASGQSTPLGERVDTLIKKLQSGPRRARLDAAEDLGEMGPFAANAVAPLIKSAQSENLALRHESIIALGKIGPAAKPAVEMLVGSLDEKSPLIRHASAPTMNLR